MDVTGSQKIKATQAQVFQALLNPEVLKASIPGCEAAEFVDSPAGRILKLSISTSIPGFKGPHTGYLRTGSVSAPSSVELIAQTSVDPSSAKASCVVTLAPEGDQTNLSYNAHADLAGTKIAAVPEILLKGAVKSGLEHFFKNFEKQVSSIPA